MYHIRDGNYGDNIKLDGLDIIYAGSWPKEIHEGNVHYSCITGRANKDQRQAIENIFTGKAKGEGPFAIFAGTFKYIFDPQYADIKARIDGRKSSFSVSGIIDVHFENFINPGMG